MYGKTRVVAIEEHYIDAELATVIYGTDLARPSATEARLLDLGRSRLSDMDRAGIDLQVLSHGAPGCQQLDAETAVRLCRLANDGLAKIVQADPGRFAAFAILPTPDPAAAADELERAVTRLGFRGAIVHGLTHDRFIDERRFWPIFERAEQLDVPIYLHPAYPSPAVAEAYYNDYADRFPELLGPALGFTLETATQGVRLVLSGVFEAHPRLKFIMGHLGEGIPFLLWRINESLSRPGNSSVEFRDLFREHFWLTTSGNFSDSALACSIAEMGVERILFAVDWPYVDNAAAVDWLGKTSLADCDKVKIFSSNAGALLKC